MRFTAHGAARNVTGSKHVLSVGGIQVLLDCGLFQGRRAESERRNRNLPFDPASIDVLLLSHAHVDHCGSIPTLVKHGFRGKIFATHATVDLCDIMLRDSAFVQSHDLSYLNKRRKKRGETVLHPVYTLEDVEKALEHFSGVDYDVPTRVAPGVTVTWRDAGHILGSALLEIDARERGSSRRIVFTGDLGRRDVPILKDPYQVSSADVLITESTYGSRTHSSMDHVSDELASFISEAIRRRGKIIVPSFAVGRTQRILYCVHELMRAGRIPEFPIYVDSPMAVRATKVFRKHAECFDSEMKELIARGDDPLGFSRVQYVMEASESKKLNRRPGPMMIVSASGMCEAGRVLHHLKNNITRRKNAILIIGYQAEHTLGRRIAEGNRLVRIFGQQYPMKARVKVFNEFSAHADRDELLAFANGKKRPPRRTIVVHGSEDQAVAFGRSLTADGFANVSVPIDGETIQL